jgi:altronate dehydratase small subunit
MNALLKMNEKDNVAVCLADGKSGDTLTLTAKDGGNLDPVTLMEEIPFAHKVALEDISLDDHIIKYGEIIGIATQRITTGQWVHVHNIEGLRGRGDKK